MDGSTIPPDEVTKALAISESYPRLQMEKPYLPEKKKEVAVDPPRPREDSEEQKHFAPPNAKNTKEEIPRFTPKQEAKKEVDSDEEKKKKVRIRIDLNRIAKAKSPLRKIGVPLFASDEAIVAKQQETVRNYHANRIEGYAADKTINKELEVEAEAGMRDVMGLVDRRRLVTDKPTINEVQKQEIEKARAQRLKEIDGVLSAIERASDERQLASYLEGMIPNGSYDTVVTMENATNRVVRVTSRGKNGLESVMMRGRQTIEKVIHPATLKRDGITDPTLIARANRAEDKIRKAYSYIRDSLKQKMDHPDKVDFHARKDEKPLDKKVRTDREAAAQAEVVRKAALIAQEAEQKRQREAALAAEAEKIRAEEAERLEREEIKKTRQTIEKVITETVLNMPAVKEDIAKKEETERKARMKEALIKAYNTIYFEKKDDPESARIIRSVFYPSANERMYLGFLAKADQHTSTERKLSYIDAIVSIRLEESKQEVDGPRQIPRRYVNPEYNTWYGPEYLDKRFSTGIEALNFDGDEEPELAVTVKGFKEYESRRIAELARQKIAVQFETVDGQRKLKAVKISDSLTLHNTENSMKPSDPAIIEYYVLRGTSKGKTYTVRLRSNLVLYDISVSKQ